MIFLWSRPISITVSCGLHAFLLVVFLMRVVDNAETSLVVDAGSVSVEVVLLGDEETTPMQEDTDNAIEAFRAEDEGYIRGEPAPLQAAYSPPSPPAPSPDIAPELEEEVQVIAAIPDEIVEAAPDNPPVPSVFTPEPATAEPAPLPPARLPPKRRRESKVSQEALPQPPEVEEQVPEPELEEVEYDLDNFASLLNQIPDVEVGGSQQAVGNERKRPKPATESEVSGFDLTLTRDEEDSLKAQVSKCWNLQLTSVPGEAAFEVTLAVNLDRQGQLIGKPQWIDRGDNPPLRHQLAAESSARAIINCQPYNSLPVEKYETWRRVEMNFDPSDMMQ